MRKAIVYILICVMALGLASCHNDLEDYFTSGEIALVLPVDGDVETIQYSVKMMNLNSRNVVTLAGKTSGAISVDEILRGAYSINVDGIVQFKDAAGEVHAHQFRAQSDFVEMIDLAGNHVELEMILMD